MKRVAKESKKRSQANKCIGHKIGYDKGYGWYCIRCGMPKQKVMQELKK